MSSGMMELRIDKTKAYVISKGRLPKDFEELIEWLNEFAEFERKCSLNMYEAYREHLATCNRPMIIYKYEDVNT
jgi:hypothetical protein